MVDRELAVLVVVFKGQLGHARRLVHEGVHGPVLYRPVVRGTPE